MAYFLVLIFRFYFNSQAKTNFHFVFETIPISKKSSSKHTNDFWLHKGNVTPKNIEGLLMYFGKGLPGVKKS